MWGPARVRRRVCSATRARRATASAVAWPMAARACQKYWPRRNLESFVAGVMGPKLLEPTEGASVGEDVEEAQELAMDLTRGADDARQECVGDTRPRGVGLPVATHLCRRRRLEDFVGLGIPERPVEADIGHVIAAELVDEGNIND